MEINVSSLAMNDSRRYFIIELLLYVMFIYLLIHLFIGIF